jgi:hypothetical protein
LLRSMFFGLLAMFAPVVSGLTAVMLVEPTAGVSLFVFLGVATLSALPLLWLYDRHVHLVAK